MLSSSPGLGSASVLCRRRRLASPMQCFRAISLRLVRLPVSLPLRLPVTGNVTVAVPLPVALAAPQQQHHWQQRQQRTTT